MNSITQHYIVDFSSNNNYVQIAAAQGDGNNTRYIEIEMTQNGSSYTIDPSEVYVSIIGTKPDGTEIWNPCEVTQEGYIKVPITYQMSSSAGKGTYQIMIFSQLTNNQIKSFPFYLNVTKAAFDPRYIQSSDEFQVLIGMATSAEASAQVAEASAQIATEKASEATTSAATATQKAAEVVSSAEIAVSSASAASASETNAAASAASAAASATASQSWAVGGTGTRTGEDSNNAQYWCSQAQAIARIDDFTGATESTNGTRGLLPAPTMGQQNCVIMGDGAWKQLKYMFVGTTAQWTAETNKAFYSFVVLTDDQTNLGIYTYDGTTLTPLSPKPTIKTATLAANATSVVFTGIPTTGDYMIEFFISDGSNYSAINTSTAGQVTLTYEASSSARTVICKIEEGGTVAPEPPGPATLSSIEATKTKTTYDYGETFSTSDVTVTAIYSDSTTANVTSSATIDSSGINTSSAGTQTLGISYTEGGVTKTTSISITVNTQPNVYGVEWDGSSSPAWTRTDDSASFADPQPYYSGMSGTPSSPFDNLMPWAGMEIVNDADLGSLVSIPKFWYKWTRSGSSMKLQISDGEKTGTGWHVSPAHADRGDGSGERDVVYIGRYHCAANTYKSTSGVLPQVSKTRAEFRTAISALHTNAWQYDFAMWWTINMLYLVEFANWNSQAKIGGGCSQTTATSSAVFNMGSTDSMPYHTGTTSSSIAANVYGANQYRYIENLWGNCLDFIDGIYFDYTAVYCIKNPANFSDTTGGTNVGTRAKAEGVVTEWTAPSASGFEYALYPAAVTTDSNYETYSCDTSRFNGSNDVLLGGSNYEQYQGHGAFFLSGKYSATVQGISFGSRLMKLP